MKTMTAKYPGTCAACGEEIRRGDQINFFGRGRAEHTDCTLDTDQPADYYERGPGGEPSAAELVNDRRMAKRGLSVTRYASGEVVTQNSRGRCEDAPCCGCCS